MKTKTLVDIVKAEVTPLFVSFHNAAKLIGLTQAKLRQVVEDDPTFPKMRRLSVGIHAYCYEEIVSWATNTKEATNG